MSTFPRRARSENRAPALVGLLVALGLYAILPEVVPAILRYGVALVGLATAVPLVVLNPRRLRRSTRATRIISVAQGIVLTAAAIAGLAVILVQLVQSDSYSAPRLLLAAVQVWVFGVIGYAILFWQIDRGGPVARHRIGAAPHPAPDFYFPQEELTPGWAPSFLDYLLLALQNAMAFTPTSVIALRPRAKALTAVSSFTGFVLLGVVVARGVAYFA